MRRAQQPFLCLNILARLADRGTIVGTGIGCGGGPLERDARDRRHRRVVDRRGELERIVERNLEQLLEPQRRDVAIVAPL